MPQVKANFLVYYLFMRVLSFLFGFFLVLFEITLIYFYFSYPSPLYHHKNYVETPIVNASDPTCDSFITRIEAQQFYEENHDKLPTLSRLDHDGDGKVCENLP